LQQKLKEAKVNNAPDDEAGRLMAESVEQRAKIRNLEIESNAEIDRLVAWRDKQEEDNDDLDAQREQLMSELSNESMLVVAYRMKELRWSESLDPTSHEEAIADAIQRGKADRSAGQA
jgi:hypothetical protein